MSEVQARSQTSSRGRGGGSRGGRGSYASRGGNNRRANGDKFAATDSALAAEDEGDIGELRKKFGSDKVETIKELFPDWSDADILYALQETDGDIEVAATRISEGTISQWGEVSKPKKTNAKPKVKESAGLTESSGNSRPARGGRGDARGGRARGAERARGSRGRAAANAATNGHRVKENQQLSTPTDESSGWGKTTTTDDSTAPAWGATDSTPETTSTNTPTATSTTDNTAAPQPTVTPPQTTQKTWASMLRQSTAPKPAPKPKETPAPKPTEAIEPLPPVEPTAPKSEPQPEETPEEAAKPTPPPATAEAPKVVEPEAALPQPEDDLTKQNLEQLPDESHPPTTATAASTAADSWDPRQAQSTSAAVTPLSASQAQHQNTRGAPSGFVASALKATERPTARMPSYQRRLLEQEEAVRMPGNREVDRAAVQFGAFSLNGGEDDIDGDREDPETRGQPPLESPSQPRATLPPAPQQPAPIPDAFTPTQKPAASLPQQSPTIGEIPTNPYDPKSHVVNSQSAPPVAPPTGPAATTAQRMSYYPQLSHPTNTALAPQAPSASQHFGRFNHINAQESTGFPQKPYESFSQQQTAVTSAGGFEGFPAPTTQAPGAQNTAFSSAPGDYSSYYTADQHGRGGYNYYGHYNQQSAGQNHHEGPNSQTRGFGYNASQNDNLSQYPQSAAQQSRFGAAAAPDAQNSGHNTPNPPSQAQHQQTTAQASQPQSSLHQQPHGSQYPYAHPYYSSPYYANYVQHFNNGAYSQGGYGGAPYGKGGMYGQPHQYGMSPQGPYDHASSPATSGFGQSSLGARDSALGSSIDNYGRAGSTPSVAQAGLGGGFGGIQDTFGRGSAYPQAGQAFGNPNAQASNAGSGNDDLKPYESKVTGGPSPLAAAARPGSAANTPAVSGLPPPQSAQQGIGGYGGYPSHLQGHGLHSNQSAAGSGYGLGASSAQSHGSTPYGGFGGNQGFNRYYSGQQQQQGGWGGNYH